MADTEKSDQPQTNGLENGLNEDERTKMRPADIDADVKEMERRKRVEMIMSSKLFREELERIIELQLKDGNGPAGLLQQISDMMGIQSGKLHTTHMFRGSNCVTPINDIRGVESMGYEKGEKNLRCKLASVFRLMDLYGWSQGINNQITARLNQDEEHFLVNPHGMLFNEITASSLVKVDMQGNIVEPGTTNFSVNTQGFLLHSAIHASRPDVNCVIHIKTPSVLAVSSLKCGLLPICQEALVIGEVSQHPFVSGIFEPEEREKIIRNLGPHNKVLLLHNHGAVCCGATVEEAFYNVYNTVLACETQMKLMPIGVENLLLVSDETRKQVYDAAHRAPDAGASSDKKKFRVGEMEFEALIRMLDNAGFRTGYIYRHPLVKGDLPKPKNDVEVPPAVSSLGYLIEQEELYKQGNWKKYVDGRNRLDRTKWLNSPNVYQKVEILETGTSDPKKITKWVDQNSEEWVAESSPTHSSTPVKIDSALQFVPKGTNPKEFKKLQQQIKENRRADKITSGPQSHILEGVSWEEAKKLQDANITQTGDQVILVGAASKGIIQRNYQHNALVYKTPYAKNPFDSMSDKEIEDYKQLVERKQRGDTDYEESQSESEAISSSRQDGLRHFKSPLLSPQSATSETEEESRDEPRVLRIETKTAPRPIQAEVVLSDAESDMTDARIERSHSARYPKAEKPESITLMNSFRKSWSLKREKDKSKDVDNTYDSRNLHPSLILNECERDRMESLQCCVARFKQLTYKPVFVDLGTEKVRPLLKSVSDPCNLSTLKDIDEVEVDNRRPGVFNDPNTSRSYNNIMTMTDLQNRLNVRKKLLRSAKMKFLGFHRKNPDRDNEMIDETSTSPVRALISEIRETLNEIMSPERTKISEDPEDHFSSLNWINRSKFTPRCSRPDTKSKERLKVFESKSLSSFTPNDVDSPSYCLTEFKNDFQALKLDLEKSERSDKSNCSCAIHGGNMNEKTFIEESLNAKPTTDGQEEEKTTEVVKFVNASDEEATYTITDDSLFQTYSFTESTDTEWYYNKTIMKLENSQTVLEIKENENKEEEISEVPAIKYADTGIDTDFTSEKEVDEKTSDPSVEEPKQAEEPETVEDVEGDALVCETSNLNKSSETDSSFLKSSSGQTSNDVDTSFAFKTETENSEKTSDRTPEKSTNLSRSKEEKNKFLEQMLLKTKEPIEEESSDSGEVNINEIPNETCKVTETDVGPSKLPDIAESPEFTNIDTEDAPVTSSSKDTSPEVAANPGHLLEGEANTTKEEEEEVDPEGEKESSKPEHKRKNVKSSTKITVKKELKGKNSDEPIVSEIKLTIKNRNKGQSEKYEVKIQDVTNTSEELSRSVSSAGENVESYESFEIMENSCDCEAQQSLEELQNEVSSTVEKLQTIEGYFEEEIKKHSNSSSEKKDGTDEFTIEYNYTEFEEVLNESQDKMAVLDSNQANGLCNQNCRENAEFFVSSLLGDLCGEIEVCSESEGVDVPSPCPIHEGVTPGASLSSEKDIEDIAVNSAFVAAVLSQAILEDKQIDRSSGPDKADSGEMLEVICNIETLSDVSCSEETTDNNERLEIERSVTEMLATLIDSLDAEEFEEKKVVESEISCEKKSDVEERKAEDQNSQLLNEFKEDEECQQLNNGAQQNLLDFMQNETNEVVSVLQNNEITNSENGKGPHHCTADECLAGKCEKTNEGGAEVEAKMSPRNETGENEKINEIQNDRPLEAIHDFVEENNFEFQNCTEPQGGLRVAGESPDKRDLEEVQNMTEPTEPISESQVTVAKDQCYQLSSEVSNDTEDNSSGGFPVAGMIPDKGDLEGVESVTEAVESISEAQDTVAKDQCYQLFSEGSNDTKNGSNGEFPVAGLIPDERDLGDQAVAEVIESMPKAQVTAAKDQCYQLSSEESKDAKDGSSGESLVAGEILSKRDLEGVEGVTEAIESISEAQDTTAKDQCYQPSSKESKDTKDRFCSEQPNVIIEENNNTEEKPKYELSMSDLEKSLFPPPLKAITFEPHSLSKPQGLAKDKKSNSGPAECILNCLLTSAIENSRKSLTVSDVINFIVANEESPTDSLVEFEDMENKISTSSSVVADVIDSVDSLAEGEVESLVDEEEVKELETEKKEIRKMKKDESMFKVTIATPSKKEIFINYSLDRSSIFNTSTDLDQFGEFCNSYIRTDDVNEDFENMSSDNPDFFSATSSDKNSLNSSFCSLEGHIAAEQFCCLGCEDTVKSPRSLAIIQEVDEGDSSTSSDVLLCQPLAE